ncbi:EH domain-containing and endocytosis protein 1 [Lasiodiplodia hormozganensis]|uniref:EH domain-containing and endocytosis protein 1 n=1 Tax=Lasiodiplodia hormozganensis TaxID=869390 RepID=A0AA39Z0Z4_9PEZI|nr:EH domain-containing and endocytosis protein 1 [Lasiodiplodia hormozganensis]
MTDPSQSMELNTPLNLTPEEKRVFGELFRQADTEQMGVVTGEVAVKFFERTKLPPQVLGEIWQIADTENRGLLTSSGFCQVLRLIGHFQAGKAPTPELAFQPGPLPKFDNSPPSGPAAPGPIQPQMSGPIRVPPLAPERAAQYATLFEKSGAVNGVLPGETAKNIFEKARLPNETLGRVWALADTEQRGALGVTEFIIAMHLIQSLSSGAMKGLPSSLPAGLYEAASRRGPAMRPPGSAQGPIPRQFSGQNTGRGQSPMSGRPPFATPPQSAQPTGNDWLITPQEKASYDNLFSKVDTQGRGFITGEQAVVFFSDSGLPEEVLAAIWDLADINSEGQLNRDEFAVAMYLIRQQRPKPGVQFLPPSLPPALIPPSMRSSAARPPAQSQPPATFGTTASFPAPAAPAVPAPKSASEDLFGLDAFTASPPVQPQSTGGSAANFAANKDPFGNGAASPASPSRGTFQPTPQNPTSIFKPFMPSSSFGQTLTAQGTGGSGSQPRSPAPPQPSAMDDLLGDNDQEQSKKLTDESAELGNMSNQINTLRTQMQETHNRKASTEAELNTTSAQKRDLEMRLSQFRAQYEAEVQIVKQLEERLNASRQETRKLQQEMAMLEGSYQDLSSQHQQVASALEADQRENANLKERIRQTNAEVAQLRPQLDKMRSEARQQKGMVAINKKQLATNEGEREKLKNEMSELTKAAQESYNRSPEATPGPTVAASPAPSNASHSTNPFFRRSPQPAENTMSPSGFSREASQANFDNFFGPSISSGQSGAPNISAPSGQSVQSSEPGVPTPSTSPPLSQYHESPRVGEPPAPPESRQFSSSILPIREGAARQGSFSSSVKAAPPTSRFGAPGNETPTNAPGSPSASAAEPAKDTSAPEFGPSPFNRNLTSSPAASHVSDAARSASGVERKDTFQSFGPPSASVDMPGSFPEVSTPLKPETTGQSAMSDRSKGSFSFPRSDPFGSQPQRQGSAAKADFDAAFAGFGAGKQFQERQNTGSSLNGSVGSASKFNQEFPPIENLGGDDESDSNSEHGFDDNFAPSSPQAKRDDTAPAPTTSGPEGTGDSGNPFSRDNSNLPTPNAQKPPPTYEQTTGHRSGARGSDSFPPEFGGLLPSRQDPTAQSGSQSPEKTFSSPVLTPGQTLFGGSSAAGKAPATGPFSPGSTSNANTPSSTVPSDAYHSAQSYPSTDKASPANQAPGSQSFGDDFDAGFDDLAEAKDATNAHDDDDLFGSSHRDGLDEFNPVFDSPAASKSNTMASQATPTNNASKNHAEDSFSDFEHLTQSFASSKPATQSAAASGHDWDAIFSGLSDSQPAPSTGGNTAPQTADSSQMLGAPSGSEQPASGDEAEKPHLGRALSAGTEHDDPILKNLTSMGYQRGDALAALEKYDYDINKAVEYLSSK